MDEHSIRFRIVRVLVGLTSIVALGVGGYHWIEGWSYFESLYMTVITITTVGYGEVHPLTSHGRAFTMFLILSGIGVLTYAVSILTAFIVEGELRDALRRRRMQNVISKLTNHYIICGAGHTGQMIIEELTKTRRPFVIVEKDPARVEELLAKKLLVIQGDATEDTVLIEAGIQSARGVFAAMPKDPDNAFISLSAKGLNPKLRIVAKQEEIGVSEKLRRSGADAVVHPAFIGGLRMASEMIRPAVVGFLDSMLRAESDVFRIEEVAIPEKSPLIGKPLNSIKGTEGNTALILALKHREAKTYEINPPPSRVLSAGEILVAMGTIAHLRELESKVGV